MAKLPLGMRAKVLGESFVDDDGKLVALVHLRIAWWAWPILLWQAIRAEYEIPWHQWPFVLWVIVRSWYEAVTE